MAASTAADHQIDSARVDRIRRVTKHTLETYNAYFTPTRWWPYELVEGAPVARNARQSFSTASMIAHALAVSTGAVQESVLVPAVTTWRPVTAPPQLERRLRGVVKGLAKMVDEEPADRVSRSSTWGADDPLTLVWLHELLSSGIASTPEVVQAAQKVRAVAERRVADAFGAPDAKVLDEETLSRGSTAVPHIFPMLRLVHLDRALGLETSADEVVAWLERQLHLQLSQNGIRDSDFDAAQLIFCVEALMTVRPGILTTSMIDRVGEVLLIAHDNNPYWRPVRPLTINAQGQILLPQSVEVANSLLRIRTALGVANTVDPELELLNRYCEWVLARSITVRPQAPRRPMPAFEGWQSEHTHAEGTVHLWATSQVLLFLQHHGAVLQHDIARRLRDEVGVIAERPSRRGQSAEQKWESCAAQEPLLGLAPTSPLRVYSRTAIEFVAPRREDTSEPDASCSMLLYGPPGTGKSSFAKGLAASLDFDFLTITPSDFIESGEADVEARAKALFRMLHEQSDAVVLFDEIDRFILGRDRKDYEGQSDMFQFMTPSMLTKLNDLRKPGRVIFIIATNYVERIDSAIKRPGRIDAQLLLMPPDLKQRQRVVEGLYERRFGTSLTVRATAMRALARATPLFAYSELEILFKRAVRVAGGRPGGTQIVRQMAQEAAQFTPAINVRSYMSRFRRREDDPMVPAEGPVDEFVMVLHNEVEAGVTTSFTGELRELIRGCLDETKVDAEIITMLRQTLAT